MNDGTIQEALQQAFTAIESVLGPDAPPVDAIVIISDGEDIHAGFCTHDQGSDEEVSLIKSMMLETLDDYLSEHGQGVSVLGTVDPTNN